MRFLRSWTCAPIVGVMLLAAGCGHEASPVAPGPPPPSPPQPPAPPTYTVTGTVTEYRGGPVEGLNVVLAASPSGTRVSTRTDAAGHYSLSGTAADKQVKISVSSNDPIYWSQSRSGLSAQDQTVDFLVEKEVTLLYGGEGTVAGTIYGDQIFPDDTFGGRCASVACIPLTFECCASKAGGVELTLSWNDPSRELVLYVAALGSLYEVLPATRVCCGSPLTTVYSFNGDFDVLAIGFESVRGGPPGPNDSVTFQLTAKPRP